MKNRKSFLKGALCGALAMLLVAGLVSCELRIGSGDITAKTSEKLSELQNLIDKHYMGDVKEKDLEDGIYKGYISGLNDPYSVYYNKKETKALYESTGGEYDGVGAVMSQSYDTGVITITQVYKDSPAEKAGMQQGDILTKVEGEDLAELGYAGALSKIRGEAGTTVQLTIQRNGDTLELDVEIGRAHV